ncbi:hypothetical protein VTI74DRAFT_4734 [Chaetomium olivicolor]
MKTVAAVLLTTATVALAALNIDSDVNLTVLASRQECVYSCGCQDNKEGEGPDPDTTPCCGAVDGSLENEGTLCAALNFSNAQSYARCCGTSGGQAEPHCSYRPGHACVTHAEALRAAADTGRNDVQLLALEFYVTDYESI